MLTAYFSYCEPMQKRAKYWKGHFQTVNKNCIIRIQHGASRHTHQSKTKTKWSKKTNWRHWKQHAVGGVTKDDANYATHGHICYFVAFKCDNQLFAEGLLAHVSVCFCTTNHNRHWMWKYTVHRVLLYKVAMSSNL